MGFLKKVAPNSEYVLLFSKGLKSAEILKLPYDNKMIIDGMRGTAYPVGTDDIRVKVHTQIPANSEIRMYMLHANGAGVFLEPGQTSTEVTQEEYMQALYKDYRPVEIREDRSVLDMKTTPELNNMILSCNILGRSVAIDPDKRTVIAALIAGLFLGSIFLAPIMGFILRWLLG